MTTSGGDDEGDGDEDDPEAARRRRAPGDIPVWQRLVMLIGIFVSVGYLIWELGSGYGKMNPAPKNDVLVLIGGLALMAFPLVIRIPAMVRFWRDAGPPERFDDD